MKFVSQEMVNSYADRIVKSGLNSEDIIDCDLQINGGKCPDCGTEYKYTEVQNSYASFSYFAPQCTCLNDTRIETEKELESVIKMRSAIIPDAYLTASFSTWDYYDTKLNTAMKKANEAAAAGKGAILYGAVGSGKTHCACSMMRHYIEKGKKARYYQGTELVKMAIDNQLGSIKKYDVIMIDDIDKLHSSGFGAERIFSLIDSITSRKAVLIVTTNLKLTEFEDRFGEAIMSRILEYCDIIPFEGDDYRKRKRALQKQKA